MAMVTSKLLGIAILAALLPSSSWAQDEADNHRIDLKPGFAQILRLNRSVRSAIVGDPELVDVVPSGDRMMVVTAKKLGETNLILLNEAGQAVYEAEIVITTRQTGRVQIHSRGASGGTTTTGTTLTTGGGLNSVGTSTSRAGGSSGSIHEYYSYQCSPTGCRRVADDFERDSIVERRIFIPADAPQQAAPR
jgi:Flp pilus assembly secretin CpaC